MDQIVWELHQIPDQRAGWQNPCGGGAGGDPYWRGAHLASLIREGYVQALWGQCHCRTYLGQNLCSSSLGVDLLRGNAVKGSTSIT